MSPVTSLAASLPVRIIARVALALVAPALALVAAPAHADVAVGWSDPEDVDALQALLLLGGVPLLLFVLIALAVYVPAMVRGESLKPAGAGSGAAAEAQWLGGPRASAKELASDTTDDGAGGARGRW